MILGHYAPIFLMICSGLYSGVGFSNQDQFQSQSGRRNFEVGQSQRSLQRTQGSAQQGQKPTQQTSPDVIDQVQQEQRQPKKLTERQSFVQNRRRTIKRDELPEASVSQVRRFHQVLDELLAEFSYDVKSGQMKGLKNLSVRRVQVNDVLPRSYEAYVEMLVSERIRENANVRLINCLPCKTKSSTLAEGKLVINSPASNVQRLDQAAGQLSIENFMDVILVYHTTHMVLAFNIFDAGSKELVWARTYNSETIRSRYQKLAIDYKQIERGRGSDEYEPEYRILLGAGAGILPNINATNEEKRFFNFSFRGGEKFNNRRDEFGLLFNIHLAMVSFQREYPSSGASGSQANSDGKDGPRPYRTAYGLYAYYARNLLGDIESYDQVRHGFHGAAGFFIGSSYLAPSARAGWDIFLGRRFTTSLGLMFNMPSSILVNGEFRSVAGGVGGDVTLSLNL